MFRVDLTGAVHFEAAQIAGIMQRTMLQGGQILRQERIQGSLHAVFNHNCGHQLQNSHKSH